MNDVSLERAADAAADRAVRWRPNTVSRAQVNYATWVCFFAWVFAVYDFILFGTLLPRIGEHFKWSASQQISINTWVTLGTAIVALGVGPIVDRMGRKNGIIFAVAGAAICSGLTAVAGWVIGVSMAVGIVALILVRSLAGLGYSEQAINATYLSELFAVTHTDEKAAKRRGFIYSLVQGGWPIGALLTAALVTILYPLGEQWFGNGGGWVLSFIFAMFPAVVIAILGRKLVETPQFEVIRRIRQLRRTDNDAAAVDLAQEWNIDLDHHDQGGLAGIFRSDNLRATLTLSTGFFLNWFAIVVFVILGTSLLAGSGGTPGKHVQFTGALEVLMLSNIAAFLGYMFHGWLGDRIGRRATVAVGWIAASLAFYLMLAAPNGDFWKIVPLYSLGLFFLIGPYSALLLLIGESFPTSIRATAGASVNACGQIGAIVAGFGITHSLSGGSDWIQTAMVWGVVPCVASGLCMFLAKNPVQSRG